LDFTASSAAELVGISVRSMNTIYLKIRQRLAESCEQDPPLQGAVEVDESYFGAHRVRGKRGRGAYGKTIVFDLLKCHGKVYTEIVPDCSRATLQGIIRGRVEPDAVIHSDGWRGYNGLVDIGFDKHLGCITVKINLPMVIGISMASSRSGATLNGAWQSLTVYLSIRSICT
jgi:transposase-like protein